MGRFLDVSGLFHFLNDNACTIAFRDIRFIDIYALLNIYGTHCYICPTVSGAYNIGIFHWRPTESSKKLAKHWKELLLADEKIWDQNGFNDILRMQLGPSVDDESGLFYAYDGNLKLGLLPSSIFCSGHTYFIQVHFLLQFFYAVLTYLHA